MSESPQIDLTKIDFPSDRITIKDIRRRWPESVDTGGDVDLFSRPVGRRAGEVLTDILTLERDFAKATFDIEQGRPSDLPTFYTDIKEIVHELVATYINAGIADGPTSSKELVRGIKTQAIAQSHLHTPPRP